MYFMLQNKRVRALVPVREWELWISQSEGISIATRKKKKTIAWIACS